MYSVYCFIIVCSNTFSQHKHALVKSCQVGCLTLLVYCSCRSGNGTQRCGCDCFCKSKKRGLLLLREGLPKPHPRDHVLRCFEYKRNSPLPCPSMITRVLDYAKTPAECDVIKMSVSQSLFSFIKCLFKCVKPHLTFSYMLLSKNLL